jgi:hypothetical protein
MPDQKRKTGGYSVAASMSISREPSRLLFGTSARRVLAHSHGPLRSDRHVIRVTPPLTVRWIRHYGLAYSHGLAAL